MISEGSIVRDSKGVYGYVECEDKDGYKVQTLEGVGYPGNLEEIDSRFTPEQASEILPYIEDGIDYNKYINPSCSPDLIFAKYWFICNDKDPNAINFNEFDRNQLAEIVRGMHSGVDFWIYANPAFTASRMESIRSLLFSNLNPTFLISNKFSDKQAEVLADAMCSGIDVSAFAKPEIDAYTMKAIAICIYSDFDILKFDLTRLNASMIYNIVMKMTKLQDFERLLSIWEMDAMRRAIINGLDSKPVSPRVEDLLRCNLEFQLNQLGLSPVCFRTDQLKSLCNALNTDIDFKIVANPAFSGKQIDELVIGYNLGVNIKVYANPNFNTEQMYEIRKGLCDDLDVSVYARPEIPASMMRKLRIQLLNGEEVLPPMGLEDALRMVLDAGYEVIDKRNGKKVNKMNLI